MNEPTSTCSPASADSPLLPLGTEFAPYSSAKSTDAAESSSPAHGRECQSTTTSAPSPWPTAKKSRDGISPKTLEMAMNGKAEMSLERLFAIQYGSSPWPTANKMDQTEPGRKIHARNFGSLGPIAGETLSGSLPAASPASLPLEPVSSAERRMTAGSGRKLSEFWPLSGPLGSASRILLESETWASPEFSLKWRPSATKCGCLVFRLVPSVRRIGGSDTGLWGTAWPMPASRDEKGQTQNPERPDYVPNIVKRTGPTSSGCLARTEKFVERLATLSAWLMGYTAAYLALWVTASSRKSRPASSQP